MTTPLIHARQDRATPSEVVVSADELPKNGEAVLLLTPNSPEGLGGAEHFLRRLDACLRAHGYDVYILHRGNSCPRWLQDAAGKFWRPWAGALIGYYIGRRARRMLRDSGRRFAAVISNGAVGWYPLPGGVQRVQVYHGTYAGVAETTREFISFLGYLHLKYWEAGLLERFSGRGKTCVAVSNQVAEEVQNVFGYRAEVCWLPLDAEFFGEVAPREQARAALGLPDGRAVGLFVGNINPYKGFQTVLALARKNPDVSWVVALRGDAPQGDVPGNVKVLRDIPHAQMKTLYAAADFALVPYRLGPFSYALIEPLACGVPVIASPARTSPDFLRCDPLGQLLVDDQQDVEGFQRAIDRLAAHPDLYRAAVSALRPALRQLTEEKHWAERFCRLAGLKQ